MADTPKIPLPYISGSQAQKEVTHNEALDALDVLVQCNILDRDLNTPPGGPAAGATYIVAAGAVGAWAGKENQIAAWISSQWKFWSPDEGWYAYVQDENLQVLWDGAAWGPVTTGANFLALADTPGSYNAQALKHVRVNAGETALEFTDPGAGTTTFTGLTDTPASYVGQTLKYPRVNAGETALEFVASLIGAFTDLTDTPANYVGHGGKIVSVNGGETALEFIPQTGGALALHRGALIKLTGDVEIPDDTPTLIPWNAAIYDTSSIWDVGQPTRLTVPAGVSKILLVGQLELNGPAFALRRVRCLKNAAPFDGLPQIQVSVETVLLADPQPTAILQITSAPLEVVPGDYFTLEVYQQTGIALDVVAGVNTWWGLAIIDPVTFLGLTDTPASYAGQTLKDLRVNAGETAVEFYASPYDVGGVHPGKPTAAAVLLRFPFPRAVAFPAGLTSSQGVAGTAATAQTDFDIRKNGVSFGTMRFAAAGTVATFIAASPASFAAGDILTVVAPNPMDATCADLGFALAGTR